MALSFAHTTAACQRNTSHFHLLCAQGHVFSCSSDSFVNISVGRIYFWPAHFCPLSILFSDVLTAKPREHTQYLVLPSTSLFVRIRECVCPLMEEA
jgi:hypothetical protein